MLFLLFESAALIILAGLVRFCCIFWRKKKLQGQDLGSFLEKRVSFGSLHTFSFFNDMEPFKAWYGPSLLSKPRIYEPICKNCVCRLSENSRALLLIDCLQKKA
jgi:hypothetical protein